ncbi:MAG: transcriptional regulator [Acidimicrobiales bacterium]
MPRPSDTRLLVLHALRLRGHGEAAVIGALAGLPAAATESELDDLADAGLVAPARGVLTGWALTPAGRAEHRSLLATELDAAGCREKVDAAYRRFGALNQPFLEACTDWQQRDGVRNDHTDRAYDVAVLVRLRVLHHDLQPVLDDLEACLDRFAHYRSRFEAAWARIEAGEQDWFTKPMIDSYHTIWFQLHEDLLTTLGLERAKEGS